MKKTGFTLIELIAVMAVMAVVLGFAVVLLVKLLDFQRNNDEYSNGVLALDRFVTDFRSDVQTYGKPELLSEGDTLLRWHTEMNIIFYTAEPGGFSDQKTIVRSVYKDGTKIDTETYRLPERTALHFADGEGTDVGLIALSLWTAPQGTEVPKLAELNPFDRTIPKSLEQRVDPKYAGNWRTIVVRY